MKRNEQENATGQNQSSKKKQYGVASKTMKTEPKNLSEPLTSQSKNGSQTLETPKEQSLSESVPDNGSGTTPKKTRKPKSLMPVPKLPSLEKRTIQALKRLKVKDKDLAAAPQVTSMIKTTVKGGLKVALEAMRFSTDDTEIAAFLKKYDSIPIGDRDRIPWEAVSIAARVNPKHLLGAIQLAVQTHCWNRSRFIAVSNHPAITKARVKYGKMPSGERDRMALDIQVGAMQGPKGPTFIGKQVAVFGGGGGSKSGKNEEDDNTIESQANSDDGFDDLFPSPNDVQEKLVPIRQRLLEG